MNHMEAMLKLSCFISAIVTADLYLISTMTELHEDLLRNISQDVYPRSNISAPLKVQIQFSLTSLNDLDEVKGELQVVGYLTVTWNDARFTWNPMMYGGIGTTVFPRTKVWAPPLILSNPTERISDLNADIALVRFLYTGTAIWNPGDIFKTKCSADIYKFPFDEQTCLIGLTAWGYLATEILLLFPNNDMNIKFYKDNGEWLLKNWNMLSYEQDSISVASISLTFKRRPEFIVTNMILPIILMCVLNAMVFVIPPESGERVSYSITLLLSFAVFMTIVNDNIPKTSAPMPFICFYFISVFGGSASITIFMIINLRIHFKDNKHPIPKWMLTMNKVFGKRPLSESKVTPLKKESQEVMIVDLEKDPKINKKATEAGFAPGLDGVVAGNSVTWPDIAETFDRMMLCVSIVYFTAVTVCNIIALVL
ncbi:hypothetical protein CHS0354_034974 [Potamilus streckersoni]|uniref:Uncharacterized protein n=1 Tax=Potamilus streckersoni TaxID=2493646 RepID=A0AAE0VUR7_9BIVA|nr:hypothetical protein CHS0354_034974 [Potamilus streckersoni]